MSAERELNVTTERNNILKHNLTSLEREFHDLNNTVIHWRRQLENYISGGISGEHIKRDFFLCISVSTYITLII